MNSTLEILRNQIEQVKQYIARDRAILGPLKMCQGDIPDGAAVNLDDSSWRDVTIGDEWGGSEEPTWFRVQFVAPDKWQDEKLRLVLQLSKGPEQEALLYIDGEPKQGFDRDHGDYLLADSATKDQVYLIAICASCLGREGMDFKPKTWSIDKAEVQVIDRVTEEFYFDALVALEVARTLAKNSPECIAIVENLTQALKLVDFQDPTGSAFYETVKQAQKLLRERVYDAMQSGETWKAVCVGNAHIDVAWLWTIEETRRKCARTFSTVLSLMVQYPDWYFIQSQPQLYEFLKRDYPQIYNRIQNSVNLGQGRWEATGAMWVEADTTLVSGESLVRQILFGTRFFKNEFGVENTLLWLPDSFGYTAALPQILVKSGLKYFMTTKMSWNEFNRIPMDTFWWEGLDGSKVLTHLITSPMPHRRLQREVHTYRGDASVKQIQDAWEKYLQRNINDTVLYAYGYGDGGGGPTREMLERLKRLANFPGVGRCQHTRAEDFFDMLPRMNWPTWDSSSPTQGELYFECHRGVYTTRARNKRSNRKCELLYRDAELFSVWAQQLGKPYPQSELNEGWKELLRNQCHDILSGVCIRAVHEQCERDYNLIKAVGEQVRDAVLKHVISHAIAQAKDADAEPVIVVFNSLSWERTDIIIVEVPVTGAFKLLDSKDKPVLYQVISISLSKQIIAFEATVPSCGYATYRIQNGSPTATSEKPLKAQDGVLENQFFKIKVSPAGEITLLCDKRAKRQVLPRDDKGKLRPANVFQFFQDKPLVYEAWDIDLSYYQKKLQPEVAIESTRVIELGPVRAGIEVKRRLKRKVGDREFESFIK